MPDYGATWGATLGFNLNQDEGSDTANSIDLAAQGVCGVTFNVSAVPPDGTLRFIFESGGTDYCVEVTAAGTQTVAFSAASESCWEAGGATIDGTSVSGLKWQIATNVDASYAFDFCITELAAATTC